MNRQPAVYILARMRNGAVCAGGIGDQKYSVRLVGGSRPALDSRFRGNDDLLTESLMTQGHVGET